MTSTGKRFALETLLLWLILTLPINVLTFYFWTTQSLNFEAETAGAATNDTTTTTTNNNNNNNSTTATGTATLDNPGLEPVHYNSQVGHANDTVLEVGYNNVSTAAAAADLYLNASNGSLTCYEPLGEELTAKLKAYEFWVSGVALSVVGCLGVVGNVLTLIALIKYETNTNNSFNKLLVHLTVVDLLLIVVCVHEFAVLNAFVGSQPHWYIVTFPYLIHPLKQILLSLCIFLMVAVSSERCQAICHPLRERPSPHSYVFAASFIAVSLNARKFFEFQLNEAGDDYETANFFNDPDYIKVSSVWHELIVTGLFPFVALVVCNIRIYSKIRESTKHEKHRHLTGVRRPRGAAGATTSSQRTVNAERASDVDVIEKAADVETKDSNGWRRGGKHRGLLQCRSIDQNNFSVGSLRVSTTESKHQAAGKSISETAFSGGGGARNRDLYATGKEVNDCPAPRNRDEQPDPPDECHHLTIVEHTEGSGASRTTSIGWKRSQKGVDLDRGQRVMRKRHEKSVLILVLIVFVFLVCHSFRLGVQTFQTLNSDEFEFEQFEYCSSIGRSSFSSTFMILISFNNLFLVLNSSINFIIYCAVRKTFRRTIWKILFCISGDEVGVV